MIIGRKKELNEIREAYKSEYSQFIAVYGRRRVGKTFLVRGNYSGTPDLTINIRKREAFATLI